MSPGFLKLYGYEKKVSGSYFSSATSEKFFFSEKGRTDPLAELQAAVSVFTRNANEKFGEVGLPAQCAFPARFEYLSGHFPSQFKKIDCPDFQMWQERLGVRKIRVVFASLYPTNPASMFGHTFLRFVGERKGVLNYSAGFLAQTNANDNVVLYTLKGIFGGYHGSFEMKPYYVNVGIYNNGESRNLYEYELGLKAGEVSYLMKVLWEYTLNTSFPYYFFNENCSTYILKLIEVVRPEINIRKNGGLISLPVETIKDIASEIPVQLVSIRPSLYQQVKSRYQELNESEQDLLWEVRRGLRPGHELNNVKVADTLIDDWNYRNYKKKTLLSTSEKNEMEKLFNRRSELSGEQSTAREEQLVNLLNHQSPLLGHRARKISLVARQGEETMIGLNLRLGQHGQEDPYSGHGQQEFIDYLSLKIYFDQDQKKIKWDEFQVIHILSLTPYFSMIPKISWKLRIRNCHFCYREKGSGEKWEIDGGIGQSFQLTSLSSSPMIYYLIGPAVVYDLGPRALRPLPKIDLGMQFWTGHKWVFNTQLSTYYEQKKIYGQANLQLTRSLSTNQAMNWQFSSWEKENRLLFTQTLGYSYYF